MTNTRFTGEGKGDASLNDWNSRMLAGEKAGRRVLKAQQGEMLDALEQARASLLSYRLATSWGPRDEDIEALDAVETVLKRAGRI